MSKKIYTDEELRRRAAARTKAWREKNPDRAKEAVRRCQANGGAAAYQEAYRRRHPERSLESSRKYVQSHHEQVKQRMRYYYRNNQAKIKAYLSSPDQKERVRAYNVAYRMKNREAVAKINKAWAAKNRDARLDYMILYDRDNRDKIRKKDREYASKYPEKMRSKEQIRRARKFNATIGDLKEIEAFYKHVRTAEEIICHWCNKPAPKGQRHVDHEIPLAKDGKHCVSNLRASCASCNLSKHDKLPADFLRWLSKKTDILTAPRSVPAEPLSPPASQSASPTE